MSLTALLFLLIFVMGIVSSIVVHGAWAFYLYELVYFANPKIRWWGSSLPGISYSFVTVSVMIACVVVKYAETSRNRLRPLPMTKWFAGILCVYAVVQTYAVAPVLHEAALIDYLKLYITLILAYKLIDTPKKLELALWMYIVGAAYIGWEAYVVGRNDFGRVEGIGPVDSPEANGVAAALVPAVPLLMYFVAKGTVWQKAFASFFGIWIVNGLVLINSRGSFIGVLAGAGFLLFYLLLSIRQTTRERLGAVMIVVAGLGGMLYLTDDQFWSRMDTLTQVEDESASGSHRYRMWLSTFELVDHYPGGVGASGFQTLSPIYVDPDLFFGDQKQKAVHSMWFQTLAEIGWLGLALFLALVASCWRTIVKARKAAAVLAGTHGYFQMLSLQAGFIGYLAAGSFIDQFRAQILYWCMLFIACAYNIYVLRGDEREVPQS